MNSSPARGGQADRDRPLNGLPSFNVKNDLARTTRRRHVARWQSGHVAPTLDGEAGLRVDALPDLCLINDPEVDVPGLEAAPGRVQYADGSGRGVIRCPLGPLDSADASSGTSTASPDSGTCPPYSFQGHARAGLRPRSSQRPAPRQIRSAIGRPRDEADSGLNPSPPVLR